MNKFIMLVGLPASGKSKVAQTYADTEGYTVHSSDALREELFGDVNEQNKNKILFQELHKRIIADLKDGVNVVYDATNISWKRRRHFLHTIKNIECYKKCVLVYATFRDCIMRDMQRIKCVGYDVIDRMYRNINIPYYYEGWDDIEILYTGEIGENISHLIGRLKDIEQDNPHHTLTIGNHCMKCCDNIFDKTEDASLLIAALLHDIGKEHTLQYNKDKGYDTFYQHHLVGAYDAIGHMKHHFKNDITNNEILEITNYIQWHMQPFFNEKQKTKDKYKDLWGEEFYENIMLLHEADKLAK